MFIPKESLPCNRHDASAISRLMVAQLLSRLHDCMVHWDEPRNKGHIYVAVWNGFANEKIPELIASLVGDAEANRLIDAEKERKAP